VNVRKTPKPFLFTLIGIFLVGIPLTLFSLQQQQIFQPFAWSTQQSAVTKCSTEDGSAVISVTFANTESTKAINVTASDLQTGQSVDLGTVKAQDIKAANIITGKSSLTNGSVIFRLTWANGSAGTDQLGASYKAINNCPVSTNFCPANAQNGTCTWEPVAGAKGYNVVVKQTDTGTLVQSVSVSSDATQSAFPMTPGVPYECTVTPTNECGGGTPANSPEKTCTGPTPTPTPPACFNGTSPKGVCTWDAVSDAQTYNVTVKDLTTGTTVATDTVQAPGTEYSFTDNGLDTYECDVTSNNVCGNSPPAKSPPSTCSVPTPTISVPPTPTTGVSPTPTPTTPPGQPTPTATPAPTATPVPTATPTPKPTATPIPTATPRPLPTPTPVVIVKILTPPPPQTVVVQQPPQQTIVRVPGQTQTVVVTQPPQPTARPYSPVTPVPTVMATGNTTPAIAIAGISTILLIAGGIFFFLL
jgi:hypothetical protein